MPDTPEQLARQKIDAQLIAAGWVVQDFKQFNPAAGRGVAHQLLGTNFRSCWKNRTAFCPHNTKNIKFDVANVWNLP
jgi:hypothetical protein